MMVNTLIRIFVKTNEKEDRRIKIGILCGCVNVFCNIILFIFKLIVGIISGSVAVTADAFNNLSDTFSSIVTITGFHISKREPDRNHPFGYGRLEYISGCVVSILVIMVGVEFIKSSVKKIITPEPIELNITMIVVLAASILVKLWMGFMNTKFSKAMGGSTTLKATAVDSISDVATTTVALIALILSNYMDFPIDGCLGLVIAVAVIIAGVRILIDTISPLLGQPAPELVKDIYDFILRYDGVLGAHDIIVHNYGPMKMIATVHVEVSVDCDIIKTHEVIDKAEREIGDRLGITIITHLDPIVTNDKMVQETKSIVEQILIYINPEYEMHDFRIINEKDKINLVFDVLVPYGLEKTDYEIEEEIYNKIKAVDSRYNSIITIDKSFAG